MHGLYPHLGFDYSLNYLTGPQVCFVELFLWSTRHGSSLSCSAVWADQWDPDVFFAWLISSTPQAFLQPQSQGRPVCLSVCLRGTRLPQVAHMSSASRSCNTGSVIDPNQMLTVKKRNVPLAALDELSSSTLVLILPSARCNTQDVAPWLATVRQNREFII